MTDIDPPVPNARLDDRRIGSPLDIKYRKRRKAFNVPGHSHFLTFSCYQSLPHFNDDTLVAEFLLALKRAKRIHNFLVFAYVVMPEHVHLLIHPRHETYDVSAILKSIKLPVAKRANSLSSCREIGERLTPFWQSGGGYDKNLTTSESIWSIIDYIHSNPVRRNLVTSADRYEWSSASAYVNRNSSNELVDYFE